MAITIGLAWPQAPASQSFVGTVAAFKPGAQVEIKPDKGAPLDLKLTPDTVGLRIAPGEKSLKNATPANVTDLTVGDRVLVSLEPDTTNIRRIVIMSASDIQKRDEADRQEWKAYGIAGIVTATNGHTITLRVRSLQGETTPVVTLSDQTRFRRYAPDSVRFADAKPSMLSEVHIGDQLRARGEKSADGLSLIAEEVVFGTFLTVAGSVVAVDATTQEITVKQLGTGKLMSIKLTPDSKIKQMPSFPGMGGPPPEGNGPPGGFKGGPPPGGFGAPPAGAGSIADMVEMMPKATLDDVKVGQTVVVSSTKGTVADHSTAIMLIANAGMLVQMASRQAGGSAGRPPGAAGDQQGFPQGAMAGGGIDLGGMLGGIGFPGMGP